MPIRTMYVDAHFIQARRIRCGWCSGPFTYVVEGRRKFEAYGILLVSSAETMERRAFEKTRQGLVKLGKKKAWGEARCPLCGRFQAWMVRRSRVRTMAKWGLGLGLPGLVLWAFQCAQVSGSSLAPRLIPHLVFAGILGLALFIGWKRSLPSGDGGGRPDLRAATDGEVQDLLTQAGRSESDPVIEWFFSIHETAPAKALLVSMGCEDLTGEGFFPGRSRPEAVLAGSPGGQGPLP